MPMQSRRAGPRHPRVKVVAETARSLAQSANTADGLPRRRTEQTRDQGREHQDPGRRLGNRAASEVRTGPWAARDSRRPWATLIERIAVHGGRRDWRRKNGCFS